MRVSGQLANERFSLGYPPVIVLKPLDVILSEISATLDLDEDQSFRTRVFNTVSRADWNIDGATSAKENLAAVKRHSGRTRDHHPVLRSVRVFLIAQTFLRQHFDAFNFVVFGFVQNCETAPRTFITHAPAGYTREIDSAIAVSAWSTWERVRPLTLTHLRCIENIVRLMATPGK